MSVRKDQTPVVVDRANHADRICKLVGDIEELFTSHGVLPRGLDLMFFTNPGGGAGQQTFCLELFQTALGKWALRIVGDTWGAYFTKDGGQT